MDRFAGRLAVVTGGGSGIGRELARQLVAEGCHVALCDVLADGMAETVRLCEAERLSDSVRVTACLADVSDEAQVLRFRDHVVEAMETRSINLLFNNAGITRSGSLFTDSREAWERTFNVCWYGCYYNVRAFLPLLQAADAGHIVNTSSVSGFWASVGPNVPHTSYSAAKFAIKGFTEALITDLALNAPHVKCSVVMPGHVGTGLVANSRKIREGVETDTLTPAEIARQREQRRLAGQAELSDAEIQAASDQAARLAAESALTSAGDAARIILDGVRAGRWRILVGPDAELLDKQTRLDPEAAYTQDFYDRYGPSRTAILPPV